MSGLNTKKIGKSSDRNLMQSYVEQKRGFSGLFSNSTSIQISDAAMRLLKDRRGDAEDLAVIAIGIAAVLLVAGSLAFCEQQPDQTVHNHTDDDEEITLTIAKDEQHCVEIGRLTTDQCRAAFQEAMRVHNENNFMLTKAECEEQFADCRQAYTPAGQAQQAAGEAGSVGHTSHAFFYPHPYIGSCIDYRTSTPYYQTADRNHFRTASANIAVPAANVQGQRVMLGDVRQAKAITPASFRSPQFGGSYSKPVEPIRTYSVERSGFGKTAATKAASSLRAGSSGGS